MDKEQQLKEIEQIIYDYVDSKQTERVYLFSSRVNELAKPFVHNNGIAEALYKAGYRKTFASDKQKAYKEGYKKGFNAKLTSDFVSYAQKQAVKEFAEKLKERMGERDYMGVKYKQGVFSENDIDELLKGYESD